MYVQNDCADGLISFIDMELLQHLRQATHGLHAAIEQKLFTDKIYTGTLTNLEYSHLLLTHFLFHASLEKEIARRPDEFQSYDSQARTKTPALQRDFQYLNIQNLPRVEKHFSEWSFGQLLGACYVAEGSMLGGKVIEKQLRKHGWTEPNSSFNFLNLYGDHTGDKWKTFLQFLGANACAYEEEILQGAVAAYQIFDTEASRVDFFLQSEIPVSDDSDTVYKKLLVYDDDPDMIELLRRALRQGYTVQGYTSTASIIEEVSQYKPDAILMDYHIGETEAAQTIYKLKALPQTAHIPVYLFSGHLKLDEIAQLLPVAGFIAKPFSLKSMREYLASQLG